jgi:hypothetical protein
MHAVNTIVNRVVISQHTTIVLNSFTFGIDMHHTLIATGAYGREPTLTDWKAGKDFMIVGGPYFSIRDIAYMKDNGHTMIVFYHKNKLAFTWLL